MIESSRGKRTHDDFWDTGCSLEQTASRASTVRIPTLPVPGCSQDDPQSPVLALAGLSPGTQTLADLKLAAIMDKGKTRTR